MNFIDFQGIGVIWLTVMQLLTPLGWRYRSSSPNLFVPNHKGCWKHINGKSYFDAERELEDWESPRIWQHWSSWKVSHHRHPTSWHHTIPNLTIISSSSTMLTEYPWTFDGSILCHIDWLKVKCGFGLKLGCFLITMTRLMVTGGENDLLDHLASTEVNSWSFHCHDNHTCNFHHVDLMIIIMIHGSRLPDHFLHCCHHIMLILLILIIRFWSQQESGFRGFPIFVYVLPITWHDSWSASIVEFAAAGGLHRGKSALIASEPTTALGTSFCADAYSFKDFVMEIHAKNCNECRG